MQADRLSKTLSAIDDANARDPNSVIVDGRPVGKELVYGQRMSEQLSKFAPDASEHLAIAARAQHIERWKSPRSDFPLGRTGYKKWRSSLLLFHAKRAGEIMRSNGYSETDVQRVQYLIQKRQLKRDIESQTLENVVCLVFLKFYLDDFARKHDEEKLTDIIRKTWIKMSDEGQKFALTLSVSDKTSQLLKKSLN